MTRTFKNFIHDCSGATAIEYGLLAALIGVGIVGGVGLLGNEVSSSYDDLGTRVTTETAVFVNK